MNKILLGTLKAIVFVVGILLAGAIALTLWVLAAPDPFQAAVGPVLPLPVACSTRGCVTSTAWHRQVALERMFSAAAEQPEPSPTTALTTLVRRHLVTHAQLSSPVTLADAARYREEILNLRDAAAVQAATGLTLADYDEKVILPFLQQEALRTQRHVESIDELYAQLAAERYILVLPFSLQWNRSLGAVVE